MKKIFLILSIISLAVISCEKEEKLLSQKQIKFALPSVADEFTRISENGDPAFLLVTLKDAAGVVVEDRKELELYSFGNAYLSLPLTLKTLEGEQYSLSEFLVLNGDRQVIYVTPLEGSDMAHLVNDPLNIDFAITKDEITTVTPEVLTIDESADPIDYGYGQFGFIIAEKITTVFSSFIKGTDNFELTESDLKIEALNGSDSSTFWEYDKKLLAEANTVSIRKALLYRLTATKQGYHPWQHIVQLQEGSRVEILFEQDTDTIDVYVAGLGPSDTPIFWKNDEHAALLENRGPSKTGPPVITDIFVKERDVYTTAGFLSPNACYWLNGRKVLLPEPTNARFKETNGIFVTDDDIHIVGSFHPVGETYNSIPAYWNSGNLKTLETTQQYPNGEPTSIVVVEKDVYISGMIFMGFWNGAPRTGIPVIWKNGELLELSPPPVPYRECIVSRVQIVNGDVYAAGEFSGHQVGQSEKYRGAGIAWKNGEIIWTGSLTADETITDMVISDGDVYISGYDTHRFPTTVKWTGKVWKNGIEMPLEVHDKARITSISVSNGNVYAVGTTSVYAQPGSHKGTYWVNGRIHEFSDGKIGQSLFIPKKNK